MLFLKEKTVSVCVECGVRVGLDETPLLTPII